MLRKQLYRTLEIIPMQMILWNASTGDTLNVFDAHNDIIYDLSFNRDGSRLATTCKDRRLRIFEPRCQDGKPLQTTVCHEGTKSSKAGFRYTIVSLLLCMHRYASWATRAWC